MKSKIERFGKVSITVEKDYWDKNKAYNRLTIVERQGTRTAYLSRKVVPIGVDITDRNYWITISKWADIPYEIVQEFGDSPEVAISQKVVTLKVNELQELIDNINDIIGEGGSIDERIISAVSSLKNVLVDGASEEGDTFKKIEDRLSDVEESVGEGGSVDERIAVETNRAQVVEELLREAYESLSQSQPIPKTAEEWAAMTSWEEGVIYRVAGTTSYTDYMYNGTTTIPMATYDNAIDDEPTAGSDNLVKSGGVMSGMKNIMQGLNDTQFEENLFDKDSVSSGFLNNDGSLNESSSYSHSDYIQVYKGFTYIINYLSSIPGCFYDEEKRYVSMIPDIVGSTNKTFTIPANGYVRVNLSNSHKNSLMLLIGSIIPQSYIPYNFSTKENAFFKISQIHNNGNPLSIDDEPTADSDNLVKSGGVKSGISVGANTVLNGSRERFFEVGNLYNKSTLSPNIIDNTGSEVESSYKHSDYIPVYKGVQYVFSYLLSTPGGFYDESKNWISKLPNNSGSTINEATFIPKQNGYVRVNKSSNDDNYIVTFGNKIPEDILPYGTCTNNNAFFNINQITDFGNFSPLKGQYGNLFNKETISHGLINSNGSITESDTYSYSDYIAVKKGNTYIATSLFSSAGGFYDTNKNWVSNIPNRSSYGDYKIFVIEQDGYVRVNLYTSRKDTFILSIGTELRAYPVGDKLICPKLIINKNQIEGSRWEGKKLVCIGDSITDAGTWVDTLGTMLGTITYNRGKSGSSFAKNPNRQDSFCHRADLPASDEAGHGLGFPTEADLVFVLGGVNDWGMDLPTGAENAAIDTDTTCGAIHYLIRNLKDRYPNAKIVFGITYRIWSPTEAFPSWSEITFNDANDETAGFEYRTNTSGKTFDQIRQSIEKICSMYGIGTINLLNCGFSFWKTTDREMYSLQRELNGVIINGDGLHPSEAGSNVIAKYLCNELNLLSL